MTRIMLSKEFQAGRITVPQFITGLQNENATVVATARHRAKVAARLAMRRRIDAALFAIIPVSGVVFIILMAALIATKS